MKNCELPWENLEEIVKTMGPRWCSSLTVDGVYPCWVVWLPSEGSTTRKTLKEAFEDFLSQSAEKLLTRGETVVDISDTSLDDVI